MKPVKLTINEGSVGRMLPVFPSPEAAYIWLLEAYDNPDVIDTIDDVDRVVVLPGDFVEAEWMGCEFTYNGQEHTRIDLVRFAKAHKPQNSSGMLVSVHYGWVADCIIPFRAFKDEDITTTLLNSENRELDLPALFKDDAEEK